MSRWMMPAACRYCRPSAICGAGGEPDASNGVPDVAAWHAPFVFCHPLPGQVHSSSARCGAGTPAARSTGKQCSQPAACGAVAVWQSKHELCVLPAAGSPTLCPRECACPPAGAACRHGDSRSSHAQHRQGSGAARTPQLAGSPHAAVVLAAALSRAQLRSMVARLSQPPPQQRMCPFVLLSSRRAASSGRQQLHRQKSGRSGSTQPGLTRPPPPARRWAQPP